MAALAVEAEANRHKAPHPSYAQLPAITLKLPRNRPPFSDRLFNAIRKHRWRIFWVVGRKVIYKLSNSQH